MFQCKKFGQSIQHVNFFFANLALSHCPKICFSEDVLKTLENEEMRYKKSGMQILDDNYSCTKKVPEILRCEGYMHLRITEHTSYKNRNQSFE